MKPERKKNGFVLTGVLMLLLIATLVGGAFLFSARSSFATVGQWLSRDDCLSAIQSGIELREYTLFMALTNGASINMLDPLANKVNEPWTNTFINEYSTVPGTTVVIGVTSSGPVIKSVSNNTAEITMINTAWAVLGKTARKVREIVTYKYTTQDSLGGEGSVFDNVFFIDNIGLFSGVNCDFNGDVYANKDVDLKYSSIKVNGDSYAGGENLSKKLYKSLAWSAYGSQSFSGISFGNRVRPAEYTDYNQSNTNTYWPQGYKGTVAFYDHAAIKDMPFIGPLSEYQDYAIVNGGSVSPVHTVTAGGVLSNRSTTVSAVWGDGAGENAGIGTNDTGCLILIGTAADPINLDGIVVATGDIYIKGYYTGQGTLYSGRNIYVIGSLIAKNPATWPHPDSNPESTALANSTKDFLGLCAKGNIALGDPGGLDTSFLTVPYTGTHATDISDIELGYVSYYSGGVAYFDGDYTQPDGDGSEQRSDGSLRHFYDPIISTTAFNALSPVARIGWLDVVLYANHLIAGDFDSNAVLNGGFVCRDESIVRHGNLAFNWDIRLGSRSRDSRNFSPGLLGTFPPQVNISKIVKWTELSP